MLKSASAIPFRKMPGTRPSMLCTTSVAAPRSRTTFSNSSSTAAGSLAWHAYRRTPCVFSRFSRTDLSGFLAATPTTMPFFANSLAQLELMPGHPQRSVRRLFSEAECRSCRILSCRLLPYGVGNNGRGSPMICARLRPVASGKPTGLPHMRLDFPAVLRHHAVLRRRVQQHKGSCVSGEPDGPPARGKAFGGKNTRVRTSMLSLGGHLPVPADS